MAQFLKIVANQRGWKNKSNRELESIGKHLAAECPEISSALSTALAESYYKGHENFYENSGTHAEVGEAVESVEDAMPALESLVTEAPCPFRIESTSQLRRLRVGLPATIRCKWGMSRRWGFHCVRGTAPARKSNSPEKL